MSAVPAGATYRFERLPSQQASEASQLQLETMAGAALERVGLRRDDANPRYSGADRRPRDGRAVALGRPLVSTAAARGAPTRYGSLWLRPGTAGGWYGGGWYGPAFPPASNPWYAREVSIVLRELPSNRVVYETHARNDGPYTASATVLPVMFQAALQGFPNPPTGRTPRGHRESRPPGTAGFSLESPRMEVTRLIAVRHGETEWNVDTRIQGQLDIALNDTGLWQARRVGQALAEEPVAAIYASDLARAWQTAIEIARPFGVEVQAEPGLRERAFGHLRGPHLRRHRCHPARPGAALAHPRSGFRAGGRR